MFESDDFDQVLSQFDFPEVATAVKQNTNFVPDLRNNNLTHKSLTNETKQTSPDRVPPTSSKNVFVETSSVTDENIANNQNKTSDKLKSDCFRSPKHTKRKIINSYFGHQSKRKFPGPAGLLIGALEEPKDESICQMELFSQDIDYTQHNLQRDIFESPIWKRLLDDVQCWGLQNIDSIKTIKLQAVAGHLRKRKAQTVTAFVEAIDRSATDPLVILRDNSGSIKCTLHRDAWSTFSAYIVSECCALVLQKPTVLTTGGAFKKHYLNITLSNILAIYSSTVLKEDGNKILPEGYNVIYEEEFTVIKMERCSDSLDTVMGETNNAESLLEGLDSSLFSDDIF